MKILMLGVLLALPGSAWAAAPKCASDSDCKLLYDSCGCIAVPAADPRTEWDSGRQAVCKCNSCSCNPDDPDSHVKALCKKGKCVRSDRAKR